MAAETAFRSDELFTQPEFRRWLRGRPAADINHYELMNGRIVMTPPAGWPHPHVEGILVHRLSAHVLDKDSGIVLGSSAGYDLPSGDTVEPDVSYISRVRMAGGPPLRRGRFIRTVPNLIIEILSPGTARRDQTEKKKIYERNGVNEYWIVSPERREVTVFTLNKRRYGTGRTVRDGTIPSRVFPQRRLPAAELFVS